MSIKIKAENYKNDNNTNFFEKTFNSLEELKEYMFNLMELPYKTKTCDRMRFPTRLNQFQRTEAITLLYNYSHNLYIHLIEIDDEVHFSNGKFTNNIHRISDIMSEFLKDCIRQRDYITL